MSREAMQQALRLIEDEGHKADLLEAASILRAALAEQDDDLTAAWMAGAAEERKRAEQAQPLTDEDIYIITRHWGVSKHAATSIARAVEVEVLKRMGVHR